MAVVLVVLAAVHVHPDNATQSAWFNRFVHTHACVFGVTVVYVAVNAISIAITRSAFIFEFKLIKFIQNKI